MRSGAERIRKLNERERGVKKYGGAGAGRSQSGRGAVSGGYRKRRERRVKISTAPLTCSVKDKDFPRGQLHWVTVKNNLLTDISVSNI